MFGFAALGYLAGYKALFDSKKHMSVKPCSTIIVSFSEKKIEGKQQQFALFMQYLKSRNFTESLKAAGLTRICGLRLYPAARMHDAKCTVCVKFDSVLSASELNTFHKVFDYDFARFIKKPPYEQLSRQETLLNNHDHQGSNT